MVCGRDGPVGHDCRQPRLALYHGHDQYAAVRRQPGPHPCRATRRPTSRSLATDANGDALTFQTHTSPTHGLLRDFNPATGTFTYWPAYGYRGTDRFTFSANDGQANSAVASMNLTIVSPPDTNANGLPDAWEAAYGLSDPDGDADQDGQSNLQECLANTNPTNAALRASDHDWSRQTNGYVNLAWPSIGGTRYRVQFRNGTPGSGVVGRFHGPGPAADQRDGPKSVWGRLHPVVHRRLSPSPAARRPTHSRYYRIRVVR